MSNKTWYLLCYDIRCEKRLKKFHYRISKRALALQKSVFLVEANRAELGQIIELVEHHTHTHEDDVRLYPIAHPKAIWAAGIQHRAFAGIGTARRLENVSSGNPLNLIKQLLRLS